MELNRFWAIALPIGSIVLAILGAFGIAVYHFYDTRKANTIQLAQLAEKEHLERERQAWIESKRLYYGSGQQAVSIVDSNNNSPRLGENLTNLFSRMDQLGIALNVDMRGCAENDRR